MRPFCCFLPVIIICRVVNVDLVLTDVVATYHQETCLTYHNRARFPHIHRKLWAGDPVSASWGKIVGCSFTVLATFSSDQIVADVFQSHSCVKPSWLWEGAQSASAPGSRFFVQDKTRGSGASRDHPATHGYSCVLFSSCEDCVALSSLRQ